MHMSRMTIAMFKLNCSFNTFINIFNTNYT